MIKLEQSSVYNSRFHVFIWIGKMDLYSTTYVIISILH
jgi:hypothetical protein